MVEKSLDRKKVKTLDRILTGDIILTALLFVSLSERWMGEFWLWGGIFCLASLTTMV